MTDQALTAAAGKLIPDDEPDQLGLFAEPLTATGTIEVALRPDENTRTPDRTCVYIAEAEIGGRIFHASSRHGAANELARQLVAAGVNDCPMRIHQIGIPGHLIWSSFEEAARWTYEESAGRPLRRVQWSDPVRKFSRLAEAYRAKPGLKLSTVEAVPSGHSAVFLANTPPQADGELAVGGGDGQLEGSRRQTATSRPRSDQVQSRSPGIC